MTEVTISPQSSSVPSSGLPAASPSVLLSEDLTAAKLISLVEQQKTFSVQYADGSVVKIPPIKNAREVAVLARNLANSPEIVRSVGVEGAEKLVASALEFVLGINQSQGGKSSTCRATAQAIKVATIDPARYMKIVTDLSISGEAEGKFKRSGSLAELLRVSGGSGVHQDGGTLVRGFASTMVDSAFLDFMNGDSYQVSLSPGHTVSVSAKSPRDDGLPEGEFSGAFDSWGQNLHRALFGDGATTYNTTANRAEFQKNLEGALAAGRGPILTGVFITNQERRDVFHQVSITEIKGGYVYISDSQFHNSSGKNIAQAFKGAESLGGNKWRIPVDLAFGLNSHEPLIREAILPNGKGVSAASDPSMKIYRDWAMSQPQGADQVARLPYHNAPTSMDLFPPRPVEEDPKKRLRVELVEHARRTKIAV